MLRSKHILLGVTGGIAAYKIPLLVRELRKAGAEVIYTYSDAEMRATLADLDKRGRRWKDPIQRYKGLGEMDASQLRETTMDPKTRSLIRITLPDDIEDRQQVRDLVERLMGTNPAHRFAFIQENAARLDEEAIDA